ncbi:MAG TPA: DoxX family membrane protein [Chlamydiales bacterium]
MRAIRSASTVLARFLLSAIFLAGGVHQVFHWHESETFLLSVVCDWQTHLSFSPQAQECATFLAPWTPLLLLLATLFKLIGGLLLLLWVKEKIGAGLLVAFLIPTTILFHAFWFLEGPAQELQQVMFLKNLAIVGGLLMVLLNGASTSAKNVGFSKDSFKF